jgi:hypothetical protein
MMEDRNIEGLVKSIIAVTPAKAGVQKYLLLLDSGACPGPRSGIRRNDRESDFPDFFLTPSTLTLEVSFISCFFNFACPVKRILKLLFDWDLPCGMYLFLYSTGGLS